jgi:hypothetical protein
MLRLSLHDVLTAEPHSARKGFSIFASPRPLCLRCEQRTTGGIQKNMLGIILMEVREKLRNVTSD